MSRLRVLGVDPGSRKAGWGIIDVVRGERRLVHVDNGALFLDVKADLADRVVELSRGLREVVETYRPDVAAVEDVFVNKGARSALTLGQARGAVLATIGLCGVPVATHGSAQVKSRITGRGRASKLQVTEMVTVLLKLAEHPFEDAADALAVALCHGLEHLGPRACGPDGEAASPRAVLDELRAARPARGGRAALAELARAQGKV